MFSLDTSSAFVNPRHLAFREHSWGRSHTPKAVVVVVIVRIVGIILGVRDSSLDWLALREVRLLAPALAKAVQARGSVVSGLVSAVLGLGSAVEALELSAAA